MKTSGEIKDRILGGLWGSLVGDALGVPVEFKDRATLRIHPVDSMREYGTHHQPRGSWSDDGALILCTTESLLKSEFDLADMGDRFVRWMKEGLWTANGNVFDVGVATTAALTKIADGTPVEQAGGDDEYSNGNGSLMRILPVALRFASAPIALFANRLEKASSITHRHIRSQMACVLYGLFVRQLLSGSPVRPALDSARAEFAGSYERSAELEHFRPLLEDDFVSIPEAEIISAGYVLHTLHASLWCLLTTSDLQACVLKAVNLGEDSDTTGCVAGGLAGVLYGVSQIPVEWIGALSRKEDLDCLFNQFAAVCVERNATGSDEI